MRRMCRGEQGYALVLMMFFLALLVLSTVVAAPTVISSVQREKEKEMVWRGHQYMRGIRMFYMKMHRFPTSLDDLTKPKTGLRFMRQAYKDPMNKEDGSWRLIYVGPNGQLIGSLNSQALGMMGMAGGVPGVGGVPGGGTGVTTSSFGSTIGGNAPGGGIGGSSFGGSGFGNSTSFGNGNNGFGNNSNGFGNNNNGFGNSGAPVAVSATQTPGSGTGDSSGTDANGQNGNGWSQSGQPQPLGMMDASNTIGGNIIGVGSKINKKSFLWYQKAKNYQKFEFIWDPSKEMTVGGASQGIGAPINGTNTNGNGTNASPFGTGTNGTNGSGSGFGSGFGNSGQNPQQNQNFNGGANPGTNPPLQAPPTSQ